MKLSHTNTLWVTGTRILLGRAAAHCAALWLCSDKHFIMKSWGHSKYLQRPLSACLILAWTPGTAWLPGPVFSYCLRAAPQKAALLWKPPRNPRTTTAEASARQRTPGLSPGLSPPSRLERTWHSDEKPASLDRFLKLVNCKSLLAQVTDRRNTFTTAELISYEPMAAADTIICDLRARRCHSYS